MVTNIGFSAVATGTANEITATYSPAITLSDKRIVFLTGCVANTTTTPTFNPNSLGAKVIKGKGGVALKVGEILGDCILIYHTTGTYWELLNSDAGTLLALFKTANFLDATSSIQTQLNIKKESSWVYAGNTISPADNTSYWFTPLITASVGTSTAARFRRKLVRPVSNFDLYFTYNCNSGGSNEGVTLKIRNHTQSTEVVVTSTLDMSIAGAAVSYSAVLACNAGDEIEVIMQTPTWATNPISMIPSFTLSF